MGQMCQRCLARWTLLGLLLLLLPPTAVAQTPDPVAINDYWQQIRETQALLARLQEEPVATQQAELQAAAAQFEQITAVTLGDGRQLTIDHTFLVQELRAEPPDLAKLEALLTALLAAAETWPDAQFETFDEDSLAAILARPEFQYETAEPSPLEQWWQSIKARFWEWVARLLPNVGIPGGRLPNILLTIVGVALLAAILVYVWRNLLADFTTEARLEDGAQGSDEDLTADTALQRAQDLSHSGDYRSAVRYLYLSSLLILEERGLLRHNRALTNREYLRSVAHRPELASVLSDVIEVFDRVWYGYRPLQKADYERYARQVQTLKEQK